MATHTFAPGALCLAKWTDGHFYKAIVNAKTDNGFRVTWTEYGETGEVNNSEIIKPPPPFPAPPAYTRYDPPAPPAPPPRPGPRPPPPRPPMRPPPPFGTHPPARAGPPSGPGIAKPASARKPPPPPPMRPKRPIRTGSAEIVPSSPAPASSSLFSSHHSASSSLDMAASSLTVPYYRLDPHAGSGPGAPMGSGDYSSYAAGTHPQRLSPPSPGSLSAGSNSTPFVTPLSTPVGQGSGHFHAHSRSLSSSSSAQADGHSRTSSVASAGSSGEHPIVAYSAASSPMPTPRTVPRPPPPPLARAGREWKLTVEPPVEAAFEVDEQDARIEGSDLPKTVDFNLAQLAEKYPPPVHYEVAEEIGKGAFGTVHRAHSPDSKEEVAIKILDLNRFGEDDELDVEESYRKFEETWMEITHTRFLRHPNILRYTESFVKGHELWIVMPLMEGGSAAEAMELICPNGIKDEALLASVLLSVLKALCYLHKGGKVHKDVKADNILLSAEGEVMLADFGVTADVSALEEEEEDGDGSARRKKRKAAVFAGSPCWMAPEVFQGQATEGGNSQKADIWAFGITALELGFGRPPYDRVDPVQLRKLVIEDPPVTADYYRDTSYKFSDAYHKLVTACLQKDPALRPTSSELLRHKFFSFAKGPEYVKRKLVSEVLKRRERKRFQEATLKKEELRREKTRGAA